MISLIFICMMKVLLTKTKYTATQSDNVWKVVPFL